MKNRKIFRTLMSAAVLLATTALTQTAHAKITVTRDDYGVAKIEATTNKELFFAFGFVQARDRLLQMELLRQNAWGTLPIDNVFVNAEKLGPNQIGNRHVRNGKVALRYPDMKSQLGIELEKIKSTSKNANVNTPDALKCFAQGINLYREFVRTKVQPQKWSVAECNINELPKSLSGDGHVVNGEQDFIENISTQQRIDLGIKADWTDLDVLAVFQNRVMDEFSYRNTDLNNMRLLLNLIDAHKQDFETAGKIFNSTKWSLMPAAATTIPLPFGNADKLADIKKSAQNVAKNYHEKLISSLTKDSINGCKIYDRKNFSDSSTTAQYFAENTKDEQFPLNASNWWVVSQKGKYKFAGVDESVTSILYNGPQTGANDPSNTYQIALDSDEGFQFAGNTYTGTINFWQGHNGVMAFGLTAGNIDVADSFCVSVTDDGNGWQYKTKKGNIVKLEKNNLATNAQNAAAKIFNKTAVDMYYVKEKGWPVSFIDTLDNKEGTAYIQRSNWEGRAASSLHSMLQASQATTVKDWNRQLDTVAGNFNLSAAHKNGQIAYRLTGKIPIKDGMSTTLNTDYGELVKPNMNIDARNWNYFPSFDPRLPVPLAPEDAWDNDNNIYHSLKYSDNEGYIVNWNQKPWTLMPDGDLYYDGYYPYDRVQFIIGRLRAKKDTKYAWDLDAILKMNGQLQRMDVNFFSYKYFLKQLQDYGGRTEANDPALKMMLAWSGYREARPGYDDTSGRVHYGHVLFYEFLEALNIELQNIVNPQGETNKAFANQLQNVLFKLKQPKLSGKMVSNKRTNQAKQAKDLLTVDTSQNMQMSSRLLLNALNYAVSTKNQDAQNYTYDDYQYKFFPTKEDALGALDRALTNALLQMPKYPDYDAKKLAKDAKDLAKDAKDDAWFPSTYRTLMGHPRTLGAGDLQVSFRPDSLYINDFRNRGALNIGVAFKTGGAVEAKNVTPPGIREFRGPETGQRGGLTKDTNKKDWTANQSYIYGTNFYRPMNKITGKKQN